MTLIFSIHGDRSTNDIIDWIDYLGGSWCRINNDNWQYNVCLTLDDDHNKVTLKHPEIKADDITTIWNRRFSDKDQPGLFNIAKYDFKKGLNRLLFRESKQLTTGLHALLHEKSQLSSINTASPNKIEILLLAKKAGLSIPATCITSSRQEMQAFINKYKNAITKNISEAEIFKHEDYSYMQYTKQVGEDLLNEYNEKMYACLLQEMIEKEIELRVFYLHGQCYSMAIFSHLDEQTAVDFRNYNKETPNRNVPYKLPVEIEEKIKVFMDLANLDTGSLDIIKAKDGRYVFLEVNPVGQFGMTSIPCNYHLDKKIAVWLFNPVNKNEQHE